jgi:fatty-acyl-CoA synthase
MTARPTDFGAMLDAGAERKGEVTAAVVGDDRITFGTLRSRVARVGQGLRSQGLRRGERVAIWADNSIDWLITYLAVAATGATLVPLNTRFRRRELAHVLELTQARFVVVGPGVPGAAFPELLIELVGTPTAGRVSSSRLPALESAFAIDQETPSGFLPWAALEDHSEIQSWEGSASDIAFIQFTSGTTGMPKAVALPAGSMLRNAGQVGDRLEMDDSTRVMFPGPLYHVLGAVLATLAPLNRGARVVLQPRFDAAQSLDLIERERCTVHFGLETMLIEQLAEQEARPRDLSTLGNGMMAGSPQLIARVRDTLHLPGIITGFGMSETTASAATTLPSDPFDVRATTVGYPLAGCEIRITDPGTNVPVAPLGIGEICVRGDNLFARYDNDPAATAAAFDEEGWFHSGDSGSFDEMGRLRFHGRMSETIRVGGENVSPAEVETLLTSHPLVKMAQVVGVPDERLQQIPVAFVEPHQGESIIEGDLIEWCRGQLASFKLPRHIVTVTDWPLTGTGRVQRAELKRLWSEGVR